MPRPSPDAPVLRAAARWKDRCLRRDGSVLAEKNLWTSENVGYLARYFDPDQDEGKGGFFDKLETQLAPAPGSAKQLAAEMLWVMYLFLIPASMQAGTKRRQIRLVWEWSGEPLPDAPEELNEALAEGVANPGPAYSALRWLEFHYFIRAVEAWKSLSMPKRDALLGDPWKFAEWLLALDDTGNRQLRHILTYLLFPNQFESVATNYQKRLIVRVYRKKFEQDPGEVDYKDRLAVDREVLKVRERLQRRVRHRTSASSTNSSARHGNPNGRRARRNHHPRTTPTHGTLSTSVMLGFGCSRRVPVPAIGTSSDGKGLSRSVGMVSKTCGNARQGRASTRSCVKRTAGRTR